MVLTWAWCSQIDRLVAVPGLVVVALTFLAVGVANVISVLLLELLIVDVVLPSELSFPESQ